MGFTTGFTGGIAVTLGLAYLALRSHHENRESQSSILRAQTSLLDSTMPRSTRRRLVEQQEHERQLQQIHADSGRRREPHLSEAAKERWNSEVASFARWLQQTDWDEVREAFEDKVASLFVGVGGDEKVAEAREKVVEAARDAKEEAKEAKGWLWSKADETKMKAVNAGAKAEAKAADSTQSVLDQVKDSSRDLFGKASEAVSSAVDSISSAADSAIDKPSPETPVQRALRQRYKQPSSLDKTVSQALEERTRPLSSGPATSWATR